MHEVLRYDKCYVICLYLMRSIIGVHYMELNKTVAFKLIVNGAPPRIMINVIMLISISNFVAMFDKVIKY